MDCKQLPQINLNLIRNFVKFYAPHDLMCDPLAVRISEKYVELYDKIPSAFQAPFPAVENELLDCLSFDYWTMKLHLRLPTHVYNQFKRFKVADPSIVVAIFFIDKVLKGAFIENMEAEPDPAPNAGEFISAMQQSDDVICRKMFIGSPAKSLDAVRKRLQKLSTHLDQCMPESILKSCCVHDFLYDVIDKWQILCRYFDTGSDVFSELQKIKENYDMNYDRATGSPQKILRKRVNLALQFNSFLTRNFSLVGFEPDNLTINGLYTEALRDLKLPNDLDMRCLRTFPLGTQYYSWLVYQLVKNAEKDLQH